MSKKKMKNNGIYIVLVITILSLPLVSCGTNRGKDINMQNEALVKFEKLNGDMTLKEVIGILGNEYLGGGNFRLIYEYPDNFKITVLALNKHTKIFNASLEKNGKILQSTGDMILSKEIWVIDGVEVAVP